MVIRSRILCDLLNELELELYMFLNLGWNNNFDKNEMILQDGLVRLVVQPLFLSILANSELETFKTPSIYA